MLKVGVLGAGHLGKIHLKCLLALPDEYQVLGFYDPNQANAEKVSAELQLKAFTSPQELIGAVDVVDIVTPTLNHYELALEVIAAGKHLFIEKPITETPEQAADLIEKANSAGIKAQVGHVERFNPAFLAAQAHIEAPKFIETHRLAQFNPRGTDVPVVLDLMIHDIDIVLSVVNSPLKQVNASGVAVLSDSPDIANARLEFENGCVANLTASRISLKNMRKTRLFQRDAYISVDFLEKEAEIIRMSEEVNEEDPYAMIMELGDGAKKQIIFDKPKSQEINAIQEELRSLAQAVNKNEVERVSLHDGYQALKVAHEILHCIQQTNAIAK